MFRTLVLSFLLLLLPTAQAEEEFLDPKVAFKFSASMLSPNMIGVNYEIAEGYYMYREQFKFKAEGARLGQPQLPAGKIKFDDTFNKEVETYRGTITLQVPVEGNGPFTLVVTSQGCADAGLCYSPQDNSVRLSAASGMSVAPATVPAASEPSEMEGIAGVLSGGRLLVIVPAFILLGLGLAFTPCVLPMVPILSSIIVGEGAQQSRMRGFVLSLSYSLGMAIVYTALGVAAGLAGEGLSAALQNPWVLGAFGLLMVAMAMSMFGFYELQLPSALQSRLSAASGRQSSGKLAGVFAMGAISALIVGPCVAAPLAGALVYISQTRDVVIGGAALFAMAIGMSVPLLLVGLSARSVLPRAGAWMESVKRFFGVLMLGMALWMVSPVIPPALHMLGWAVLLIAYGAWLLRNTRHWLALAAAIGFALLGAVQLVGVATGGRDVFAPLAHVGGAAHAGLTFKRIKTTAQLDEELARLGGKTAMLDFYADWCVACKEMEKLTFVDPAVKARLVNTVLLQVDVTANDADDKAMLKRFGLFGPPGIILFDANGQEIPNSRVIGFQDARKFQASLARLP
jgi:thiol:disulfide interchange protein DsbD